MESAVARRYILLRSREGNHAGYARLEVRHGRGTVALRMAVPGGKEAVRILLLAGDAETGSVLDLGVSPLDGEGRGQCYRDNLPLPGGFKLYHTLAVVSDWPTPALLLHGPLGARTPPLWQLEDAVTRYLAVPVERPASRPDAARPTPSASPAPAPDASARCWKPPLPPSVRPRLTVGALPVLRWPKGLAELPGWFASLPPAAPFDAPGWRFVEVSLAADAPAASCAVGLCPARPRCCLAPRRIAGLLLDAGPPWARLLGTLSNPEPQLCSASPTAGCLYRPAMKNPVHSAANFRNAGGIRPSHFCIFILFLYIALACGRICGLVFVPFFGLSSVFPQKVRL